MENAVLLTTIMDRNQSAKYRDFYLENGARAIFRSLGAGTASNEMLDYLGLGSTEKGILFSILPEGQAQELMRGLNKKFRLYIPGHGIACTVRLSSFAGATALKYLTGSEQIGKTSQQEDNMSENNNNDNKYELIVAIANHGYTDQIMAAARAAHARGGTVLHATGTADEQAESFFGININPDKDMLFIVSTVAAKNDIMKAIVAEAGAATEAHAIVFSLPVSDIAGIRVEE